MSGTSPPSFSIVICSDGRAQALYETLAALPFLEGPTFEVCVVRGPTEDGIGEVLDGWRGRIKVGFNPVRNLSISRNIGIAMAAADVVAFLDDDAVPEPEWLVDLAAGFDDPRVACVGGRNLDHTGSRFQCGYAVCDRLGRAYDDRETPADDLCGTGAAVFPYVQGTNSAALRSALEMIGGFDEEYEFYLDETDVCCRFVDAGRIIRQLPGARVHHRFLPSRIRNAHRVTHSLYPVLKNKLYFSLANNRGHHDEAAALEDFNVFAERQGAQLAFIATRGLAPGWTADQYLRDVERARQVGLARGRSGERRLMSPGLAERLRRPFLPLTQSSSSSWHSCPVAWRGGGGRCGITAIDEQAPAPTDDGVIAESRRTTAAIWRGLLPPGVRVALAIYPDHWNVGDAAIWWGTQTLLADLGVDVAYACDPWSYDPAALRRALPDGPIVLLGGGNFGDVYGNEQGLRLRILSDFSERTIVQLPQSIWFRSTEARDTVARLLERQRDCTLLLRDAPSLAFARTHFPASSLLCPDAALSLRLPEFDEPAMVPVVAVWRRDVESSSPLPPLPAGSIERDWVVPGDELLRMSQRSRGFLDWVGTPPSHAAEASARRRTAWESTPWEWDGLARERTRRGCRILARGRVVITNRLHAHLLCLLLRKPHVVCDTVNGKLFAYRDTWHIDDPLVRFVASPEEAVQAAEELLSCQGALLAA